MRHHTDKVTFNANESIYIHIMHFVGLNGGCSLQEIVDGVRECPKTKSVTKLLPQLLSLDILTTQVKRGKYIPGKYVLGEFGRSIIKMFDYAGMETMFY